MAADRIPGSGLQRLAQGGAAWIAAPANTVTAFGVTVSPKPAVWMLKSISTLTVTLKSVGAPRKLTDRQLDTLLLVMDLIP